MVALALGVIALGVTMGNGPANSDDDKVSVHYPKGDCETGLIEVQVFDRPARQWRPHRDHPQVLAGTCQREDPGILLSEIRIRCIDPQGTRQPSDWQVGFDVFRPRAAPACDQDG
jgi:hypothetical protein